MKRSKWFKHSMKFVTFLAFFSPLTWLHAANFQPGADTVQRLDPASLGVKPPITDYVITKVEAWKEDGRGNQTALGKQIYARATMKNKGSKDVRNVKIRFFLGTHYIHDGASTATQNLGKGNPYRNIHVTAIADGTKVASEINENNNGCTLTLRPDQSRAIQRCN